MRIAIGSDHAGYQLKRLIMDHLYKQGLHVRTTGRRTVSMRPAMCPLAKLLPTQSFPVLLIMVSQFVARAWESR